jgi:hypothetical protein
MPRPIKNRVDILNLYNITALRQHLWMEGKTPDKINVDLRG